MPMGGSASCRSKVWPATVTCPPMGTMAKLRKAGRITRYGASLKTNRSDCPGTRSSLKNSLIPSARVWSRPKGPARLGPMRLCMSEMTLRSNQIIRITDTIRAAKTTTALMRTMRKMANPTLLVGKSGSVAKRGETVWTIGVMASPSAAR